MSSTTLPPTHRALVQEAPASAPSVQTVPTPQPTPGSAVIRVLLANVLSYSGEIYDGTRNYPYPTPLTLGSSAIGRIAAVGPDSTALRPGQLVLLDITIRARDDPRSIFLSAIHEGYNERSKALMHGEWRHGSYAEYMKAPLENLFELDEEALLSTQGYRLEALMTMPRLLVPYGGMGPLSIDVKPGETVVVAPATGPFGSAAVHVALALGAGRVVAMGRNQEVLARVAAAGGSRVKTVPLTGKLETDLEALQKHAPIDVVFDISPPMAKDSQHINAAILALRHGGRVSLMGGIGGDVAIPHSKVMHNDITIKGKWMFEREDVKSMIRLVESGCLKLFKDGQAGAPLGTTSVKTFKLEDWSAAFDAAKKTSEGYVLFKP